VRELACGQTGRAVAELPDGIFSDGEVAWQATVGGHLAAALAAIPEVRHGLLGGGVRDERLRLA
jgi:hypothetical protein